MGRIYKKTKVRVILVLTAAVTLLFFLTPLRLTLLQELFARFFYVPIVLNDGNVFQ